MPDNQLYITTDTLHQVTKDPEALNNPKYEGAGTITSDSLAGESLSSGGSFGANSGATASAQPSSSTTTNNTDISGATTLAPAPDAEARQAGEEWSETAQLNAGRGLTSDTGGKPYNTTTGSGSNVGTAPSYASAAGGGDSKPKGQNITEGGFDSDAPNASFGTEIGTKKDPGRQALADIQKADAQAGGDAGGPRQTGVSNDGQFDALGGDTSA